MPVPFKVKGSAVDKVNPFKSKTAPLVTDVPPAMVPKAALLPILSNPAVIFVAPVYVFIPDNVQVPTPFLITDEGDEMIPDIVPELPVGPSNVKAKAPVPTVPLQVSVPEGVAVIVLAEPNVIGPINEAAVPVFVSAPAGEAVNPAPYKVSGSVLEYAVPFKSKTAPLDTVVLPEVEPSAETLPSLSVPAVTVVAPVYVFVPESVNVPVPTLFKITDVAVPLLITPL